MRLFFAILFTAALIMGAIFVKRDLRETGPGAGVKDSLTAQPSHVGIPLGAELQLPSVVDGASEPVPSPFSQTVPTPACLETFEQKQERHRQRGVKTYTAEPLEKQPRFAPSESDVHETDFVDIPSAQASPSIAEGLTLQLGVLPALNQPANPNYTSADQIRLFDTARLQHLHTSPDY